jgi:hypothetical protein
MNEVGYILLLGLELLVRRQIYLAWLQQRVCLATPFFFFLTFTLHYLLLA